MKINHKCFERLERTEKRLRDELKEEKARVFRQEHEIEGLWGAADDSPTFKKLKKERKKAGKMALEIGRLKRAAEEMNENLASIVVSGENMETEVRAIGDWKRRMKSVWADIGDSVDRTKAEQRCKLNANAWNKRSTSFFLGIASI
jgi:hypothetical protein